ncbi:MAG: M1 family aminopeptidase [Pseudomonadota bacterium]
MYKKLCLVLILALVFLCPLYPQDSEKGDKIEGDVYKNERLGCMIQLPEGQWYVKDTSQGGAAVFVLTSPEWGDFNMVLVMMPSVIGIKTAEDRNTQLSNYFGEKYETVAIEKGDIDGRETGILIYNYKGEEANQRSYTHVFVVNKQTYLLQLSGPEPKWLENEQKLESLFAGISLFERKAATPQEEKPKEKVEPEAPPEEIETNANIKHHFLKLDIDPASGGLKVYDKFTVEIAGDDVQQVTFYVWEMDVDFIRMGDRDLAFSLEPLREGVKKLVINLDKAFKSGEMIELEYSAHKDDFISEYPGELIAGYNIFGQVREKSSYTSHVVYYPVDNDNATTGEVWITVPVGYMAVSVGKLLGEHSEGGRITYRWKTDIAVPRILPFAFAVAEYEKYSTKTDSGMAIEVYTWKEFEEHALKRVKVIKDIADFEIKLHGKFPFEKLAFVHVIPEKGLAGVSLPTMILLSDHFFKSDISYDLIKKSVTGSMSGPLVLADEMSHQWNIYAVSFPNELGEGMAQYTDTLFAEHIGGREVLSKHMDYYLNLYVSAIANAPDKPIASKEVYQTKAYSSIAFCKGALVLNMLRYVLGDEAYFEAYRHIFENYFGKTADFDAFQKMMEDKSGQSLDWFFEQWYHRTGYPKYEVTLENVTPKADKYDVTVNIRQTQEADVYKMPMDISFLAGDSEKNFEKVMIEGREIKLTFELDFKPEKVVLDKDGMLLKDVEYK